MEPHHSENLSKLGHLRGFDCDFDACLSLVQVLYCATQGGKDSSMVPEDELLPMAGCRSESQFSAPTSTLCQGGLVSKEVMPLATASGISMTSRPGLTTTSGSWRCCEVENFPARCGQDAQKLPSQELHLVQENLMRSFCYEVRT